jgi:hypothetical protein
VRYLGQVAGKKKIGCVSCLALLLVVVACAVLLRIARGCVIPVQGKDAQIFMCHVAKKKRRLACSNAKMNFCSRSLKGFVFSVSSIFVHSIGAFMLIVEGGIQWLHARLSAWFMTCHEVENF